MKDRKAIKQTTWQREDFPRPPAPESALVQWFQQLFRYPSEFALSQPCRERVCKSGPAPSTNKKSFVAKVGKLVQLEDIKKSAFLLGEMMGGGNGLVEMLRMNFSPDPTWLRAEPAAVRKGRKCN